MKKVLLGLVWGLFTIIFTGCFSTSLFDSFRENEKVYISFSGSMNPSYGYEKLLWGMSYKDIVKNGYPLTADSDDVLYECYLGKTSRYYNSTWKEYEPTNTLYGHGEVNETVMFFAYDRLYQVVDSFLSRPSDEYLRQRYGNFSPQNVVLDSMKEAGIAEVYINYGYNSIPETVSLEIIIYEDGKTDVVVCDEFASKSVSYTYNIINKQHKPYIWVCYAATDVENKRIDYIFVNQAATGEALFIGYSKSLENPILSYVRSGISWNGRSSGTYEIKLGTSISPRKFSSTYWNSLYRNTQFSYTYNTGDSAREMINLFMNNDVFWIRHNDEVAEFHGNKEGLLSVMNEFLVTWDELDYAIANEEF